MKSKHIRLGLKCRIVADLNGIDYDNEYEHDFEGMSVVRAAVDLLRKAR